MFPGAEGFGTETIAGRGGEVCIVTGLSDDGAEGTLRHCLELEHPRVVVFEVGGIIELVAPIPIIHPNVSVFGQTAPGSGIMVTAQGDIEEPLFLVETADVLIQHLRVRPGAADEENCCRGSLAIDSSQRVVIDHCSFSWSTDDNADIWFGSHNITMSHNLFAEGLHDSNDDRGPEGLGLTVGDKDSGHISIHHNFFAHNPYDCPSISAGSGVVDVRNNMVLNWLRNGMFAYANPSGGRVRANFVGNLLAATAETEGPNAFTIQGGDAGVHVFLSGNEGPVGSNGEQYRIVDATADEVLVTEPFEAAPITMTATDRLFESLHDNVGATRPLRDEVDTRIMLQASTSRSMASDGFWNGPGGRIINCVAADGTSRCDANAGGWPTMENGIPEPDVDRDGMPDEWERARGLDPERDDSAEDADGDGYTNIEAYVHRIPPPAPLDASTEIPDAGNPPLPGDTSEPLIVGGGNCRCGLIRPTQSNGKGALALLLVAVAFFGRRKENTRMA